MSGAGSSRARALSLYRRILRTARSWEGGTEVRTCDGAGVHPAASAVALAAAHARSRAAARTRHAPAQERAYIRQEAQTLFRQHRALSAPAEVESKVRGACSDGECSVSIHLHARHGQCSSCSRAAAPLPLPQLKEGEERLELGVHYKICYPRLHHAPQFKRREYADVPIIPSRR